MAILKAPSAQERGALGAQKVLAMCSSKFLRANQITLYTLNLHDFICQLYLNKSWGKKYLKVDHIGGSFEKGLPGSQALPFPN